MKDLGKTPHALHEAPPPGGERPEGDRVVMVRISDEWAGQRLDNFLIRRCKGVPKSHIYRIIRDGQVRVNKKRARADSRLEAGDELRIPPVRIAQAQAGGRAAPASEFPVLFEDDDLLIVNKPTGVAVHGGSGVSFGVIEQLRASRPQEKFLELVHRLDRETSGVLLLAKKRSALLSLHEQMQGGRTDKRYAALALGHVPKQKSQLKFALQKYTGSNGERVVHVVPEDAPGAQHAHTVVSGRKQFEASAMLAVGASLVEAQLRTGRTHQIRVHLAHIGHPILGDERYGDFALNKLLAKSGAKRMFLHAHSMKFMHPGSQEPVFVEAALPAEFTNFMNGLVTHG
jgi:23S rRNA pseudouridine955/2504/2580 synthase